MGVKFFTLLFLCACIYASPLSYDYLKQNPLTQQETGFSYTDNPALVYFETYHFDLMTQSQLDNDWQTQLGHISIPVNNLMLSISGRFDSINDLKQTKLLQDGTFTVDKTFSQIKTGFMTTLAGKLQDIPLSYGISSKLYYQSIQDRSVFGNGWDIGIMSNFSNFYLGGSINDIGNTKFQWSDRVTDIIPMNYNALLGIDMNLVKLSYTYEGLTQFSLIKASVSLANILSLVGTTDLSGQSGSTIQVGTTVLPFSLTAQMQVNEVTGTNYQLQIGFDFSEKGK